MGWAAYSTDMPWAALVAWAPVIVAQHTLWPQRLRGVATGVAWAAYLSIAMAPKLAPEIGPWAWCLPPGIGGIVALLDQPTVERARATGYRLFWYHQAFSNTAIETLRSLIPAVATWTMAGYGLSGAEGWRLAAGWLGVTGLSFALWACNFAIAYLVLVLLSAAPWRPVPGRIAAGVAAACLLMTAVPWRPAGAGPSMRVAAIQVGFDLYQEPWNDRRANGDQVALSRDLLRFGADLTREAAAGGARIAVWPEGFLRIVPREHPEFQSALEGLSRETGVTLAVGYVTETPDGRLNEVALVTPAGEWAVTAKDHPVPWAETGSVTRGKVTTVMVDGQRVGAMICYDADFTDTTRDRAAEGIDLLVAPAHDWPAIGRARAVHVRTRAAENRLPIIMADWMVGSVAVDATGRTVGAMDADTPSRGVMLVDLPLGAGEPSPYGRVGDLTGWASVAAFVLLGAAESVMLRRGAVASQ